MLYRTACRLRTTRFEKLAVNSTAFIRLDIAVPSLGGRFQTTHGTVRCAVFDLCDNQVDIAEACAKRDSTHAAAEVDFKLLGFELASIPLRLSFTKRQRRVLVRGLARMNSKPAIVDAPLFHRNCIHCSQKEKSTWGHVLDGPAATRPFTKSKLLPQRNASVELIYE